MNWEWVNSMSRPSLSQLYRQATSQGPSGIAAETLVALGQRPASATAETVEQLAASSRDAELARLSMAAHAWAQDLSSEIGKVGREATVHVLQPRRTAAWMRPMALAAGVAMMAFGALVITQAPAPDAPSGLASESVLPDRLPENTVVDRISRVSFDRPNQLMNSGFGDSRAADEAPIFGDRFNG